MQLSSKIGVLCLAGTLAFPGFASAQENSDALPYLQLGPMIAHPSLTVAEKWTDNVFYSHDNTESDWITSIVPGLTLSMPFRTNEIRLGGSLDAERHAEYTSEDMTPYQGFIDGNFLLGDRVKLFVADKYQKNYETPNQSPSGTLESNTENGASLSLKYSFVDVAQARLDYSHSEQVYSDSTYRTRDEDTVSAYLYYRVMPVTSAFVEYDYKKVNYESTGSPDSDVHKGFVGATWEMTEYSKGTVKAGYLSKNYTEEQWEDFSTWTASVDLQHQINDVTAISVVGKRDVDESSFINMRYMLTSGASVQLSYRFLDRLTGVLRGSYYIDEYSDPEAGSTVKREDKTGAGGVGVRYKFNSWIDVTLDYSYSNRDSNIESNSVAYNTVTLGVTAYR